jgi:hypothetical protein
MRKRNTHAFDAVDGSSRRRRERLLAVLSGLIEQHDGVGVLRGARGEAIEEYVHSVGIDLGEDEREGIIGGRPHGGIEVGGNEAVVGEARRTLALGPPAVAIAPPFWPILASSMSHTWRSFPRCGVLTASISAAKFS